MAQILKKFWLLLWKNYVLQKRHKIQTVVEIFIPLIFTLILVGIRGLIKSENYATQSYYPSFDPTIADTEVLHKG